MPISVHAGRAASLVWAGDVELDADGFAVSRDGGEPGSITHVSVSRPVPADDVSVGQAFRRLIGRIASTKTLL